jgi:hypothetical protein
MVEATRNRLFRCRFAQRQLAGTLKQPLDVALDDQDVVLEIKIISTLDEKLLNCQRHKIMILDGLFCLKTFLCMLPSHRWMYVPIVLLVNPFASKK